MTENTKRVMIRFSKLLHLAMTILLFNVCWYTSYETGDSILYVTAVYCVLTVFFMRTYSAYQIGLSRIRMLVYSQTLANVAAAGIMYILVIFQQWRIPSPGPIFGLLLVEFLWNCGWSHLANTVYFRLYQPRRTGIVYNSQADLRHLEEIYQHTRKFQVERTVAASQMEDMGQALAGLEAVFVTGVEEPLCSGIEKYCVEHDIRCYVMPHVGNVLMMGARHMELFSVPVFRVARATPNLEYALLKRTFDILTALIGLVLCSPFMLLTALAVKCYDRGPVIYKQVRLTKDRREFEIYKFRSMRVDAEKDDVARLATDRDDRITPVGRVIRACRLDELPQLFNILRGDMSIVGPRPERPEIAEQYEKQMPDFSLRLQVRAGLTGLAQVYGKYNTDPYDKLRMDLMYINQMSLLEDIKLVFATVKILFLKESTQGVANSQITAAVEMEGAQL